MSLKAIPRSAVGTTLRLVRWPLDTAISKLPGNGTDAGATAGITLDRADAMLRDLAGVALRDEQLREEALKRRTAADERERALRLRRAADRTAERADEDMAERRERADEQRENAAGKAEAQRSAAKRTRETRAQQAAQAASTRKSANRQVRAKVAEAIEDEAAETRLEQLEREAEALDERGEALTAEAEAQRLQDAASRRKATRKRS